MREEEVDRCDPDRGTWTVRVTGRRVVGDAPQAFALIVSTLPEPPSSPTRKNRQIARRREPEPRMARWTWLGPKDTGGPTQALVVHPTDPTKLWAACLAGGVWRSEDAGAMWMPAASPELDASAVTSLVISPGEPDSLFAATGVGSESAPACPKGSGRGIWVSRDGGTSWAKIPATANGALRSVNRLAVSPDGRTLLAATPMGVFRSTDEVQSFELTLKSDNESSTFFDVEFHPTDSSRCAAGGCLRRRSPPTAGRLGGSRTTLMIRTNS